MPADAELKEVSLTRTLVALLRGVVYREDDPGTWEGLIKLDARVREHVSALGLELVVDETEGYAFLRQRAPAPGEPELPRLIARRPLSYPLSLLLALLRKKMAEHDAMGGDPRLILTGDEIAELVRVFVAGSSNEAKLLDRIHADIARAESMGFLRKLKSKEDTWEVRRILKAYVDAQWLADFDERLRQYRQESET